MGAATPFVIHLPAKYEHREEPESGLMQVLQTMSTEPDFVEARVHCSQGDPDTFVPGSCMWFRARPGICSQAQRSHAHALAITRIGHG